MSVMKNHYFLRIKFMGTFLAIYRAKISKIIRYNWINNLYLFVILLILILVAIFFEIKLFHL